MIFKTKKVSKFYKFISVKCRKFFEFFLSQILIELIFTFNILFLPLINILIKYRILCFGPYFTVLSKIKMVKIFDEKKILISNTRYVMSMQRYFFLKIRNFYYLAKNWIALIFLWKFYKQPKYQKIIFFGRESKQIEKIEHKISSSIFGPHFFGAVFFSCPTCGLSTAVFDIYFL